MAAEHLLALGHRRIAFIGDQEENRFGFDSSAHRREGFEAALAAAGCPLAPDCSYAGRTAATSLAMPPPSCWRLPDPPTAIFATSDVQAIGVMRRHARRVSRCPSGLSVIGFDDVEAAEYTGPDHHRAAAGGERRPRRRAACCAACPASLWRLAGCRSRSSTGARRPHFVAVVAGEGKQTGTR